MGYGKAFISGCGTYDMVSLPGKIELNQLQQIGFVPSDRVDYTWGTPSDVTGAPGDPETNKILAARTLNEIWAQGNLAAADELLMAEYIFHDPNMPGIDSREAFKLVVAMYLFAFSDLSFTLDDMIAEGDKVVTRWTGTGTHTGELMGIPATGQQVAMAAISIDRFADGKAVEGWNCSDMLAVMQQLGVIPLLEPTAVVHGKVITSWAAIRKQ